MAGNKTNVKIVLQLFDSSGDYEEMLVQMYIQIFFYLLFIGGAFVIENRVIFSQSP